VRGVWRTVLAGWELARLAVASGAARRSRYWAWRRETAFGGPRTLTLAERRRAMIDFALWSRRMRALTRKP